jgi:prolyl-tRNA editing enzyme YbaK/EbsC (Cys-tRNA(Pro) deacylase)
MPPDVNTNQPDLDAASDTPSHDAASDDAASDDAASDTANRAIANEASHVNDAGNNDAGNNGTSNKVLTDQDVRAYVDRHQLDARVFTLDTPTPTVERSAEVLETQPERIIKSLIFMVRDEPHVVIAAGLARIDEKKLRDALAVSRKQLRLAKPTEALEVSGYVIGSMPPFAHRRVLPTLIDTLSIPINTVGTANTAEEDTYYAGAGLVNAMMALSLKTLLAASHALACPLSR